MARIQGKAGGFFVGVVFLTVGAVAAGVTAWMHSRAKAAQHWPVVEGEVLSSRVTSRRGSKGGTTYGAEIRYRYRVNDQTHEGTRVVFGDYSSSDGSHAEELVAAYPVGARPDVHVDPDDPTEAVLDPHVSWFVYLMGGLFGGVFGAIGAGAMASSAFSTRRG